MMDILVFDMGGNAYALPVPDIDRVVAREAGVPEGARPAALPALLDLPPGASRGAEAGPVALLRSGLALGIGAPAATAAIDPTWIVPLPGFMFRVKDIPFRGIIEVPGSGLKGRARHAQRALLLDAAALSRRAAERIG